MYFPTDRTVQNDNFYTDFLCFQNKYAYKSVPGCIIFACRDVLCLLRYLPNEHSYVSRHKTYLKAKIMHIYFENIKKSVNS